MNRTRSMVWGFRVHVTVTTVDDRLALKDFYHWLLEDTDFVRRGDATMGSPEATGHMGGLEIIDVVLTQFTGLATLAMTYASWRRARPEAPAVTFTSGGFSITVDRVTPETVQMFESLAAASETRSATDD